MISACLINENDSLSIIQITPKEPLPSDVIWLDVNQPDDEERQWLETLFVEDVPEEDEMDDIESSSRFRVGPDGVHILSLFPQRLSNETRGVNMSFTMRKNLLISFREDDISIVRLLRYYIRHNKVEIRSALDILLKLQDLKVDQLSDLIEDAYSTLEETSDQITDDTHVDETLEELVNQEELNSQILQALHDTRRALRFIRKTFESSIDDRQGRTLDEVLNDIESILPHTSFISNKINFQLEASMGYTNQKQNSIIKIFSVAAVVFMPPTWIASVYGMNFKFMPELSWYWGYPLSIGMMILSAAVTYLFFRKKGWL
ncbi:MAG: magnesium/cobalt transporter CorA [Succinivibrio sp.]|uniref:magnesium/cobalt transporter CorA n=1 Tax=Succinivibrio sp. TaxID=2053619 RepID=UPI000B2DFC34|nr:magnesium/cobalt transporter CorA [Succinivibrio sp.]MCI7024432.1 magnesium/cobalt transporter CorA [Succinatimonas sp.]MCI7252482.1 magnesium/cobalt transporter CorA [Succinatimonas sp.]MDD6377863.1 magnesium/cobalt transporter CorA [Succinatimonas sp.]